MTTEVTWPSNFAEFVAEWDRKRKAGQDFEYLGDSPFPNFVLTSTAQSWSDCLDWIAGKGTVVLSRSA
jgi:hypothetical protein